MKCHRCGNAVPPDADFCTACGERRIAGSRDAAGRAGAPLIRPPSWVLFLSRFHWIVFVVLALAAVVSLNARMFDIRFPLWLTLILAAEAVHCFFTAYGLERLHPHGRTLMLIEAFVLLLVFPLGTLAGLEIIRRLNVPETRRLFGIKAAQPPAPHMPSPPAQVAGAASDRLPFATVVLFVLAASGLFFSLIVTGLFFLYEPPESVPWIARFKKETISVEDYRRQLGPMMARMRETSSIDLSTMFAQLKVHERLLEGMIDQRLLLKSAKDHKVKVTQKEIRNKIILEFPVFQRDGTFIGEKEYGRALAYQGISVNEFEKTIEDQIKIEKLVKLLAGDIDETDREKFLNDLVAGLRKKSEVRINREILESVPSWFGN